MHLKTVSLPAAVMAGLFLASLTPVSAQQTAVDTAQSANTAQQLQKPLVNPTNQSQQVPLLYQDELQDVGPQYVLQPHERPKYFSIMSDLQLYHTDNAALAAANKAGTDVTVFTVQLAVQSQAKELFDKWTMQAHAGFRFQSYLYGIFSGRNNESSPGGNPMKDLDFDIYTPYVQFDFRRDNWYASLGLRYSAFVSPESPNPSSVDENFYQEWVPSGTLGYQVNFDSNRILQLQYDGDFRATNTDEHGLEPTGWENRADNSFSVIFSHIIGEHWVVQPAYRLTWSRYTNPGRSRSDVYNTLSFMIAYYFNDWYSARVFTSVEWRNSSLENGVDNSYQAWNVGIGGSINVSF